MMSKFLYENSEYNLETFSSFIKNNIDFKVSDNTHSCDTEKNILTKFIEQAYPDNIDQEFKNINMNLIYYYINSYASVVLAAKVASYYFNNKYKVQTKFSLYDLYRIERNHYYEACYLMDYIPKEFFGFFEENYGYEFLDKYRKK